MTSMVHMMVTQTGRGRAVVLTYTQLPPLPQCHQHGYRHVLYYAFHPQTTYTKFNLSLSNIYHITSYITQSPVNCYTLQQKVVEHRLLHQYISQMLRSSSNAFYDFFPPYTHANFPLFIVHVYSLLYKLLL